MTQISSRQGSLLKAAPVENRKTLLATYGFIMGCVFLLPGVYSFFWTLVSWNTIGATQEAISQAYTRIREPFGLTLLLSITVAGSTAIVGTVLAWLTTSTTLRFKKLFTVLFIMPLALPSFIGATAFIAALGQDGLLHSLLSSIGIDPPQRLRGFWPTWLVMTLFTYPYVFLTTKAKLASLRYNVEESARLLGLSQRSIFYRVTLPQLTPAIASGALIVFLYCLSDYGAVDLLGYDSLSTVIFSATSSSDVDIFVGFSAALTLGVTSLIAVFLQFRFSGDSQQSVTSHRKRRLTPLGRWRYATVILVLAVPLFALFFPLAGLVMRLRNGLAAADVETSEVLNLATTSATASTITAVVSMLLLIPVAMATIRSTSLFTKFIRTPILAGYATPGVIIALTLVTWALKVPGFAFIYQSFYLLLLGYVIHFGSLGLGSAETALQAVPHSLKDSSRLLSDSIMKRWREVHWPLMNPGLIAGAGLIMLATIKELPATLLLAPIEFETLATAIFSAEGEGFATKSGLLSLILLSVSGLLTWLLVIRNSK